MQRSGRREGGKKHLICTVSFAVIFFFTKFYRRGDTFSFAHQLVVVYTLGYIIRCTQGPTVKYVLFSEDTTVMHSASPSRVTLPDLEI